MSDTTATTSAAAKATKIEKASAALVAAYAKGDQHDASAALVRGKAVNVALTTGGLSVRQVSAALSDHYGHKISPATIGNYSNAYKAFAAFEHTTTTKQEANLLMRAVLGVQQVTGGGPRLAEFVKVNADTDKPATEIIDMLTTLKAEVKVAKPETVTRDQQREGQRGDSEQSDPDNGSSSGVPVDDHTPTFTIRDVAKNASPDEVTAFLRAIARREFNATERQAIEKGIAAVTKAFAKADAAALNESTPATV